MKKQVFIYVPEKESFLSISAGESLNLSDKDLDEGYVDYVYIDLYVIDEDKRPPYMKLKYGNNIKILESITGGEYLIKEEFMDHYHTEDEYIKDALSLMFDNKDIFYIELEDIFA